MIRNYFFFFSFIVFLSGIFQPVLSQNNHTLSNKIDFIKHTQWVDSVFNSLTPDERIAQLFMVAAYSNRDEAHTSEIADLIRKYKIGGVIFFQGGPLREAKMTNYFQSVAQTPLLISIDGEWGLFMRLDSVQWFPRHMMLGAITDNQLIYDLGAEFANQMKAIGIHINFAPVIDINNNPLNPVINNRSFGENRELVAQKGIMYSRGMQENGVMAVAKHFPGHGDTNADSHLTLPKINQPYRRIDSLELFPFRKLVSDGIGGVMVGHLLVPSIDSSAKGAASLSPIINNGILRKSMNFNGLIFTDALNMRGAADLFNTGELEVKAVQAGNDVLLMSSDVSKAIDAIKKAIANGSLSQARIDSSCYRILKAKEWAGLNKYKPVNLSEIPQKINSVKALVLQRKIVESALTLVKNNNNIIPLKNLDSLRMAVVLTGTCFPNQFSETMSLYTNCDWYCIPKGTDSLTVDSLIYNLRLYNLIVISTHNTDSRAAINFGIEKQVIRFTDSIAKTKNVILNLLATPYALSLFKNTDKLQAIIVGYHDMPPVANLSAQLMFGGIGANGQLPVSVTSFKSSDKLISPAGIRLKYILPEEKGIKSEKLQKIDSIVNDAIRKKAFPGCQVLAAKDGAVFYSKSFGYFTYDSAHKVNNTDLYDIASVTKITATLPAVMKLYEQGDIKLKNKMSSYLHELKKTNKKDITLLDLLTHQACLQPFIPFYMNTLEPENKTEKLYSSKYSDTYCVKVAPNFYANKNIKYVDGFFEKEPDVEHGIHVATRLYLENRYVDSIYYKMDHSALLPVKQYKYSDLGFIYLYRMIEQLTKKSLNEYVESNFYTKLGASRLGYLPLNRFDAEHIAPTENDLFFRKQLITGFVHDQTAALLGGVSGHAGVFSNANDLAKLMQMYLNKGSYGGEKFFDSSTVDYFTSCPFCPANRRGIGFDKPELNNPNGPTCQCVSESSFGHSGFTGTYTWADPETGLLYIFLSNRVYPDASNNKLVELNVRTKIQEELVNAIKN